MGCNTPAFPVFTISLSLLKRMSIESEMPSNHLILCHSLFLLPSIFLSIRDFSNESAFHTRWPNIWALALVLSMNIQELIPLGLTGLISLLSKGLPRVYSSTTVWKRQLFSPQSSLWSNSHIHTWLLAKPQLWLYGPLPAKQCLCILTHWLVLS